MRGADGHTIHVLRENTKALEPGAGQWEVGWGGG